ncbi:MAG TPA: pyrroloquinoline quinone-dependent dehydrogenase [Puia sp.]|nr:pyrroloquinoline quinone-dependent dehydrogenase [Puia sp.]
MIRRLFFCTFLFAGVFSCKEKKSYGEWAVYGGSKDNIHYSSLDQLDTDNVAHLEVAWVYHTGDADSANHSQIQCNPIIVNGVLYATSPRLRLFALDAATGKLKWTFNPQDSNQNRSFSDFIMNNNRGVVYWQGGDQKRIFYVAGSMLYSVNAETGSLDLNFGNRGRVDLHRGLGRDVHDLYVTSTSPGIIFRNLLIMGSRVSEESDAAPGYIRAYDVLTGKIRWIFHTIPWPGEYGYKTWEDSIAYKYIGGANCWSGFALDEKRGILFAPTGSASFDFYGGRRKGAGLFADCLIALDAETGRYKWHFQDVHHDVWDKDLPTPPALVTIWHDNKKVDAVAQPGKTGFIYLLDRETGKPVFPIKEKPVPTQTELIGEEIWPTQPIPDLPESFMRQSFSENDINDLVPDTSYADLKKRYETYKSGNVFNPLSKEGTIVYPGLDGGAEWGGPGFDPESGTIYINANEIPWVLSIAEKRTSTPSRETNLQAGIRLYQSNCMSCHGPDRKGSGNYPALLGIEKKYDSAQMGKLISTGRRMMPAFMQLTPDEKGAIISYLIALKFVQKKVFKQLPKVLDTFRNLPYTITGYNKFLSKEGYPAIKPPWGTLNAINLNTGKISWRIPLGEYPEFKQKGLITGTENYGGPVVTAGGLVFIAATRDSKIRAFNKRTGKIVWESALPAPGFATPAIYESQGREYLVIACGGGKLNTRSGDSYIAFALPKSE